MDSTEQHTQKTNIFTVQTKVYAGPLDLLIDLIERRKLLVNDISIAAVTDDYLTYVASLESNPLREMADFVVLASTLLLLKSKSLLPVFELTEAEEESVESLEKRLKHYQLFRQAGKVIETIFGKHRAYERRFVPHKEFLFLPDKRTTLENLATAMGAVLENLPKKVEKPKVKVRTVVSLEEMIVRLGERIQRQMKLTFKDFTNNTGERSTIIVGFLAVLEMVKQGGVMVRQAAHFHEIEIEREHTPVPQYHH